MPPKMRSSLQVLQLSCFGQYFWQPHTLCRGLVSTCHGSNSHGLLKHFVNLKHPLQVCRHVSRIQLSWFRNPKHHVHATLMCILATGCTLRHVPSTWTPNGYLIICQPQKALVHTYMPSGNGFRYFGYAFEGCFRLALGLVLACVPISCRGVPQLCSHYWSLRI